MKVVTGDSVTLIYPFITPDGEPGPGSSQIVIWPNRTLKLFWADEPIMTPEAVRSLAKTLLHAARLAEKGRE